MSDRIGVMRSGRLVQVGTPEDIYNRPADRFVSEFMGDVNVITVMPNGNGSFEGVDVPGPLPGAGDGCASPAIS